MNDLKGLNRWILLPSIWASAAGLALAAVYAALSVQFPEGTRLQFVALLVMVVGAGAWLGSRELRTRLRTLEKLGSGAVPPAREQLVSALGEVMRIADATFWIVLGMSVLGALLLGVGYGVVSGLGWSHGSRIAIIGITVGPLTAVPAHLGVLTRARAAVGRVIAAGLEASEVGRAVPPERFLLRRRMVVFIAVVAITPVAIACDLLTSTGSALLARLVAADAAAQAQLVASAPDQGLLAIVVITVLTLAAVMACGHLAGRTLVEPLDAIAQVTQRVASGQLGKTSLVPAEDEVWAASLAFGSMESQLLGALSQLKQAGVLISSATGQLIASSARHEAGAADQSGALSQTSATTEELARSARQIADNASDVSRLAQQMLESAQTGKRSAGDFYASILRVRQGNQAIADSVVRLNKRVQQVGRIVEFIDGIADKSDLLALNAELEGTKAGEVGRGFSLVAAEMRRLSESVMKSTREINRLIDEIRDATNAAVMATEAGLKATDAGSALARQVSEALDRIVEFANQTTDAAKTITLATHQQQLGSDQLASAMSDILRTTQSAAGATAQMSSANSNLSSLSDELQSTVSLFEVAP